MDTPKIITINNNTNTNNNTENKTGTQKGKKHRDSFTKFITDFENFAQKFEKYFNKEDIERVTTYLNNCKEKYLNDKKGEPKQCFIGKVNKYLAEMSEEEVLEQWRNALAAKAEKQKNKDIA